MDTSKGTERVNEEGAVEIKVDAVDYRSPAGQDEKDKPVKENVEVIHVIDPKSQDPASDYYVDPAAAPVDSSKHGRVNEEGAVEIKVDAVDYRSPAGHDEKDKPVKESVEVIHVIDPKNQDPASDYYVDPAKAPDNKKEN